MQFLNVKNVPVIETQDQLVKIIFGGGGGSTFRRQNGAKTHVQVQKGRQNKDDRDGVGRIRGLGSPAPRDEALPVSNS